MDSSVTSTVRIKLQACHILYRGDASPCLPPLANRVVSVWTSGRTGVRPVPVAVSHAVLHVHAGPRCLARGDIDARQQKARREMQRTIYF
jgi:hypothetical protein